MGSRRLTQRISVLLPEPEGPQTTTTSPGATSSVTSFSTWSGPNHLPTCLYRIAGVEAAAMGCSGGYSITRRTSPGFTAWPASTRISLTVPVTPALNSFSIFMASRITRPSPGLTTWPTATSTSTTRPGMGALSTCPPAAAAPPRGRGVSRVSFSPRLPGGPWGGEDDVARLSPQADRVGPALDVDDEAAVFLGDVRRRRHLAHQQRPAAATRGPGVHVEDVLAQRHPVAAVPTRDLHPD